MDEIKLTAAVLFCLTLMCSFAAAFTYQQETRDAYDYYIIENALIEVYNETGVLITSGLSDSNGLYSEDLNLMNYTVITRKPGRNAHTRNFNLTGGLDVVTYLSTSSDGSVKLFYTDETFNNGVICLFTDAGRLHGCYNNTDIIELSAGNYSVVTQRKPIESLASAGLLNAIVRLFPLLFFLVMFLVLIVIVLYVLWRALK